jgi:hypothetical protein
VTNNSKLKVIKYSQNKSQISSLGFNKNNNVCYNDLKLKVYAHRTRIGALTDHKENIYKKIERRRKKVGGCQTVESRKKTKRKLSRFSYTFLFKEEE